MATTKIAISIDQATLTRLDRLVKRGIFPNRSRAIQEAVQIRLDRLEANRLAQECEKLDPGCEQKVAEEGMAWEIEKWPEF